MSSLPPVLTASRVRTWVFWLVPAAVLVLLLGWETDWGRQLVRMPATPRPVEPKPVTAVVLPEYQIEGGLPAHAETVARTLFNVTRRPAPVIAADSGPREIVRGRYQLMGTTVTGDKNIAFLKEAAGGKTRVVRQGEEINGMTVALVTTDRVTFTAGDDSEELILKVAPGPKTTLAATPPPPAQAPAAGGPAKAAPAAARAPAAANVAAQPQPAQNAKAARRAARAGAAAGAQAGDGQDQASQRKRSK